MLTAFSPGVIASRSRSVVAGRSLTSFAILDSRCTGRFLPPVAACAPRPGCKRGIRRRGLFQQAALADGLTRQPGTFRQVQQILLEVFKARPTNAADRPLEAQAHYIIVQTDRFKQFRAAVRGDGEMPIWT
ncbi:hypothetical protein ACLBOM_06180 [Escherichia coli]